MEQQFDAFEYLAYLRARWKFFAVTCGAAALVTLGVSLSMPKRYTATVTLLIEPGAAAGPSLASPGYLESLKIYETFASGDEEFSRAATRFRLREAEPGVSLETLKRRVLEVSKIRDTRLLEVRATLRDPSRALEFARYSAAQAVELAAKVADELARRSLEDAERDFARASADFDKARAAMRNFTGEGAIVGLDVETVLLADLVTGVRRRRIEAAAEPDPQPRQVLEEQEAAARKELEGKKAELGRLISRRGELRSALGAATENYESARKRLGGVGDAVRSQQGWLSILDAGAAPGRPSSPKPGRNVVVAVMLAAAAALVYLSVAYAASQRRRD